MVKDLGFSLRTQRFLLKERMARFQKRFWKLLLMKLWCQMQLKRAITAS